MSVNITQFKMVEKNLSQKESFSKNQAFLEKMYLYVPLLLICTHVVNGGRYIQFSLPPQKGFASTAELNAIGRAMFRRLRHAFSTLNLPVFNHLRLWTEQKVADRNYFF